MEESSLVPIKPIKLTKQDLAEIDSRPPIDPEWAWGKGRPKGTPNKLTAKVRKDILWVLQKAHGPQRLLNMCTIGSKRDENLKWLYEQALKMIPRDQIDLSFGDKGTVNLQIILGGTGNGNGNGTHDPV